MCLHHLLHICIAVSEDYVGTLMELTFSGSVRRSCVRILVLNDSTAEPPEDFRVVINSTDPDVRLPSPVSNVTIEDDDGRVLQSLRKIAIVD